MLTDQDVRQLVDALKTNSVFYGPVSFKKNTITDLSALYLSEILAKPGRGNFEKLDLSKTKITSKSGEFIGDALLANPACELEKIEFKDVKLEETGLQRLIEAMNVCHHVEKVHFGTITDKGLQIIGEHIKPNTGLRKIKFEEDESTPWSESVQNQFSLVFKDHTEVEKVKFETFDDDLPRNKVFEKELKFYCKKTAGAHKKEKKFKKRHERMSDDNIFELTLDLLEAKKGKKMLVRKFFNNTFDTLLNDAIFALKKEQAKDFKNFEDIMSVKGSIKFVA